MVAEQPAALAVRTAEPSGPPAAIPAAKAAATATAVAPRAITTAAPDSPIPAKSVAVLPFENLSREQDSDYFVAGMQDPILTKLAGVGELKVTARTSTRQ